MKDDIIKRNKVETGETFCWMIVHNGDPVAPPWNVLVAGPALYSDIHTHAQVHEALVVYQNRSVPVCCCVCSFGAGNDNQFWKAVVIISE